MGLDDIDEDPVAVPSRSAAPVPAAGLDFIFGGLGVTAASASASPAPSVAVSRPAGSPSHVLDDIFSAPVAPSPRAGGPSPPLDRSPLRRDSAAASPPPLAAPLPDTLMSFAAPERKVQYERSALDFLEEMTKPKVKSHEATVEELARNSKQVAANPHLLQLMSFYDVLGVPRDAGEDAVHAAYKRKAVEMHPDRVKARGGQSEEEAQLFKIITTAHETLSDPDKRREYDASLRGSEVQTSWMTHLR